MIQIDIPSAREFAHDLLAAQAVPEPVAKDVAEHLIAADQAGYASHGLSILPNYIKAIEQGTLKAQAGLECFRKDDVVLGYDAHLGFGQHAAKVAFKDAIQQAREHGMCAMTLRNAHHIGRTGFYGEMVCEAGMALLAFTNIIKRMPTVAPFGGGKAKLTTDPLCFAWPLSDGRPPFILDLATSAIALNKARVLAAKGEQAPAGSLIDAQGHPTADPNVMLQEPPGALLTFGAHKGYGIGLAVEFFAGILSGGGTIHTENYGNGMAVNNVFAMVFDISKFVSEDWAKNEAELFVRYLKDCPTQPGFDSVQYSGEYEAENRKKYASFIAVDDVSWKALGNLALKLDVAVPETK